MLSLLVGDSQFWRGHRPCAGRDWLRLGLITSVLVLWSFQRLLWRDYQFVGNDADMTVNWIARFGFTRGWLHAGEVPFWNPFVGFGHSLADSADQPYSLLNTLQRLWGGSDKALDYSLFLLALLFALSAVFLLQRLRFSPLTALLGGVLLSSSGMFVTQLFSGHVPIYASFSLTAMLLAATSYALERAPLAACLPAALICAAVLACCSWQGAYIVFWVTAGFFLLRAALGSPDVVPRPSLWSASKPGRREGQLLSSVDPRTRLEEAGWTMIKLLFIGLLASQWATFSWYPTLCAGDFLQPRPDPFSHSAPPISWLSFFLPHIFLGSGQEYTWVGWAHWEGQAGLATSCALVIALGVALRPRRDLLLPLFLLLPAALLAAGEDTPFFGLYSHLDPLIACFEVPSRLYFAVNFATCILCCWGIEALLQGEWTLPEWVQTWLLRLATVLAGLWILSYYSNGFNPFWQAFQNRLQFGYQYDLRPAGTPAEYYVLFWSRLSAATALLLCLIYALVRLPRVWRARIVLTLLLLDITRVAHAYLNLRSSSDFLLPEGLGSVLRNNAQPGKVLNQLQSSWHGAFARLRMVEWMPGYPTHDDEANLLRWAEKILGENAALNQPGLLNRWLGVQYYVHDKILLQDKGWRQAAAGLKNYTDVHGLWSLTEDTAQRAPVYVARALRSVPHVGALLRRLSAEDKVGSDVNYVQPGQYAAIGRQIVARGWDRVPALRLPQPESLRLTLRLPNTVHVQCFLKTPGFVILNEAWRPEWQVTVDGQPETCLPCQLGFNRGVLVGPGQHEIRFLYVPERALEALRYSWTSLVSWVLFFLGVSGLRWIYGLTVGKD